MTMCSTTMLLSSPLVLDLAAKKIHCQISLLYLYLSLTKPSSGKFQNQHSEQTKNHRPVPVPHNSCPYAAPQSFHQFAENWSFMTTVNGNYWKILSFTFLHNEQQWSHTAKNTSINQYLFWVTVPFRDKCALPTLFRIFWLLGLLLKLISKY